jgi:hypothetical protein
MSKSLPNKRRVRDRKIRKLTLPKSADEFFALPEQFQTDWKKSLDVISKMRTKGLSLREASRDKDIKINPRTVPPLAGRALKKRSNGSYAVTERDSLLRVLMIPTSEGLREIAVRDSRQATKLGRYSDALQKYLRGDDSSSLEQFRGQFVKDASGTQIPLITDLKELSRLGSAGILSFESLYARSN